MKTVCLALFLLSALPVLAENECSSISNSEPAFNPSTGEFKGCRLNSVPKDSLYARLGFKEGDVVRPEDQKSGKSMKIYESKKSTSDFKTQ